MKGAEEARQQREQLDKYLEWVKTEGGIEGPTRLPTMFTPEQENRMEWLRWRCSGKILEMGCNWGLVLAYCHGHIGVDHNEKNIELARILNPAAEFIACDISKVPLDDYAVDTVMLPDILEHATWEDVPKVINESLRLAKKRLLITLPNCNDFDWVSTSFKHQWICTMEKLKELREIIDATTVEVTPYFFFIHKEV